MQDILKREVLNRYERMWEERLTREETAELVIPDTMPDVGKVLLSDGTIYLRSREIRDHTASVEGLVRLRAVYLPEDSSELRTVSVDLPTVFRGDSESIAEEQFLLIQMDVAGCEARILNSRKLMFRCTACCEISTYGQEALTFVSGAEADTLETRTESINLEYIASCTEKSFVTSEDLTLPASCPGIDTILNYRVTGQITEIKHVAGKTVVQGHHALEMLYLTSETKQPLSEHFDIPFSQIMDSAAEDVKEETIHLTANECYLDLVASPEGAYILRFEIHSTAQCITRTACSAELLSDAYSVSCPCRVGIGKLTTVSGQHCTTLRDTLRAELSLPEPVSEVLAGGVRALQPLMSGDTVSLRFCVSALFRTAQGGICSCAQTVAAELRQKDWEGTVCELDMPILTEPYFSVAAGKAEVRSSWEMRCTLREAKEYSFVDEVEMDTDAKKDGNAPSLILARWDGEDLWELAKQYASRVSAIEAVNGDAISKGKLLLIPSIR